MELHERINHGNWTRNSMAKAPNGRPVLTHSRNAVAWCLLGHVDVTTNSLIRRWLTYRDLAKAIQVLYPERIRPNRVFGFLSPMIVFGFNDDWRTTLDDVQRVCKVAGH